MTSSADLIFGAEAEYGVFSHGLRGYLTAVTAELGVGLESCCWDVESPASVYLALDWRLPGPPARDVALLWDERRGWSAAAEDPVSGGLVVLAYLGGEVLPEPAKVARFVQVLRNQPPGATAPEPPVLEALDRERLMRYFAIPEQLTA